MSADPDSACSFRDSNAEILNIIKFGSYKHDKNSMSEILNDPAVKSKLQKILNFYTGPNESSKKKLESGGLKLAGTQPLTSMLKTFLIHLSQKLSLDEELTFRLAELFFIMHPHVYEKVKNSENEDTRRELSSITKPIITLYYRERISLIKAVTALVLGTINENNPCQRGFMEHLEETFKEPKLIDVAWNQYNDTCNKELPNSLYNPGEREEWYINILEEEKALLELMIFCNYSEAHPTPENYWQYLKFYMEQDFRGSCKVLEKDQHILAYQHEQRKIVQEIGDLCLFHLLSSIKLDIFNERGSIPEFSPDRNPYNLVCNFEKMEKIHECFLQIYKSPEVIKTEYMGPVIVSWITLIHWAKSLPNGVTQASRIDIAPIEELVGNFYIFDFLHVLTKRAPFSTSSPDLSLVLKYILMSLISKIHSSLSVENAKNYSLLVKTTCACLESLGSSFTLKHFWNVDFPNKNGLYYMLELLSKKYPNGGEDFLSFVCVLIGDNNCSFAQQIVEYLSNLQYFTVSVGRDSIVQVDEGRFQCAYELSNPQIVIPKGTEVLNFESIQRNQYIVTWKIRFSLWPVLFNYWETNLHQLKQGHSLPDSELRMFSEYLDILCKIIILEPELSSILEENGLRQPANNPLEVKVTVRKPEVQNLVISTYLLETFIELSRMHAPNLTTLSSILEALKSIYLIEVGNVENNPIRMAFKQVFLDRHGYGGLNTPHPLFMSLSKLRVSEKSTENSSVTYAMLQFCIGIFSEDSCMRIFPLSTSILSESLKYCLSEILPEIFSMPGLYKWRNSSLLLELIHTLLTKCSHFLTNSPTSCGYIELITSQLNKVAISGLIETVLHAIVQHSEFNEVTFWNIHWSQSEDYEETDLIKSAITNALRVLSKLLDIVLFVCENGPISIIVQAASDIFRVIFANSSSDELPLVSALLSYIPFYMDRSMPEDSDEENLAVLSLQCLTKIVLIWNKSTQKNSLDYYVSGNFQELRKKFFRCFYECFTGNDSNVSEPIRHAACKAFLELLIVAIPSQKNFVLGMISGVDLIEEMKKNFMLLGNLGKDEITQAPLLFYFLLVSVVEKLIGEHKKYSGIVGKLMQDTQLLAFATDTLQKMMFTKRCPVGFQICVVIQAFGSLFRILTHFVQMNQQKVRLGAMETVFNEDFLKYFLSITSKPYSNESSVVRIKDLENQAAHQGLVLNINDFIILQSNSDPSWKLFESNPHQYGYNMKYNHHRLKILLSNLEFPIDQIVSNTKAFKVINLELSLVDSQFIALTSFNTLLGYSTSFGYSGILNSALHVETPKNQINPLMISQKQSLPENIQEIHKFIYMVTEMTWNSVRTESNLIHPDVVLCIKKKFEILLYSFSYIIHITATSTQGKEEESQKSKDNFKRLAGKILAELVDFLAPFAAPETEILNFIHVLLSFFSKSYGFESKPDENLYALIMILSKFIQHNSEHFYLSVFCLDYAVSLSDRDEFVNVFRQLQCNRIIVDKLSDEKCSDLDCFAALRYLVSFCKKQDAGKFIISLRLFQNLQNCKLLKENGFEYEGRGRNSKHVIWCWVLTLLNQLAEVLAEDQISLGQIFGFLTVFNERITATLEFNFVKDGKGGQVFAQKQFSLAYLEELELISALLCKLTYCVASLKKNDKEKVEFWVSVVAAHSLRIFNMNTDVFHCFPPTSEHEVKNAAKFIESKLNLEDFKEQRTRRSIFEPAPRPMTDPKQKTSTNINVFLYRVQTMLNYVLENFLSIIITSFQLTKVLPGIDLNNLVGALKFLLSTHSLITNNTQVYAKLDEKLAEDFRDPDYTSNVGGVNFRYENGCKVFLGTCKKNFEMIFYVLIKFDLNKVPDIKNSCYGLLSDWIKMNDQGQFKGEPKDPYLAYVLDQINTF